MKPITIDFETLPIGNRPAYPPKPVGVAIKYPNDPAKYYAWGHPSGNTCEEYWGLGELRAAWGMGMPLLFHNSKFDVAVACEALGLPMLPWAQYHDTMFLAYLADPHAPSLGLKELAADLLNWPADERDDVAAWIMAHGDELHRTYGAKFGLKKPTKAK